MKAENARKTPVEDIYGVNRSQRFSLLSLDFPLNLEYIRKAYEMGLSDIDAKQYDKLVGNALERIWHGGAISLLARICYKLQREKRGKMGILGTIVVRRIKGLPTGYATRCKQASSIKEKETSNEKEQNIFS